MGIFHRASDIIAANLNDLIDQFEDPERMLRQAIREMEAAVSSALDGAVQVIASEKLLTRQLETERYAADQWHQRAQQALAAEDEPLARQAVARKLEHQQLAAALADQQAAAIETSQRLRRQVDALRARLAEARRKLAALVARQRAAAARRTVARHTGGIDVTGFNRFDRMTQRVEQAEAEADALLELSDLELDWPDVATEAAVDAELAALRLEAHGG